MCVHVEVCVRACESSCAHVEALKWCRCVCRGKMICAQTKMICVGGGGERVVKTALLICSKHSHSAVWLISSSQGSEMS